MRQQTEPWGSEERGPCDKCDGKGTTLYRCSSCLEAGARVDCLACEGRVRFSGTCPACLGHGEIAHTVRSGIAVFPRREGLYRYLATKDDAEPEGKLLVELEGTLGDEPDLDADAGALLVHPRRVLSVEPLDAELVAAMRLR